MLTSGPLANTLTRLDLPIRLGEDVGAVLETTVGVGDKEWHLARMNFTKDDRLWIKDSGQPVGQQSWQQHMVGQVSQVRCCFAELGHRADVVGAGEVRCSDGVGCSVICEHKHAKR